VVLLVVSTLLISCHPSVSSKPEIPPQGPHQRQQEQFGKKQPPVEPVHVLTGIEVLEKLKFRPLKGKTVGVIANQTSVDRRGKHLVDLLDLAPDVKVGAIFAPEHGFRGRHSAGATISDTIDSETGAPIYSLFGKIRKPTPQMLQGLDALVFDIQDIGARFYTYISTLGYVMQAAAESKLPLFILDRPNPLSGHIDGNVLDYGFRSFVGMYPIPIQHGLTVGELARLIQGEVWLAGVDSLELHIVTMDGWTRDLFFNETDLPWRPTSPNMTNMNAAMLYPGLCLLEATNCSEGRGTEHPFEWIGAPYIKGRELAQALWKLRPSGLSIEPVDFVPRSLPGRAEHPKYLNERVEGVALKVLDPHTFHPVPFGVNLLVTLKKLYPEQFKWRSSMAIDRLWGDDRLRKLIDAGASAEEIIATYQKELAHFKATAARYLLYPAANRIPVVQGR